MGKPGGTARWRHHGQPRKIFMRDPTDTPSGATGRDGSPDIAVPEAVKSFLDPTGKRHPAPRSRTSTPSHRPGNRMGPSVDGRIGGSARTRRRPRPWMARIRTGHPSESGSGHFHSPGPFHGGNRRFRPVVRIRARSGSETDARLPTDRNRHESAGKRVRPNQ